MRIGFDGRFIRRRQTGNGVFTQLLLEGLVRLGQDNDYTVYVLEDALRLQQPNVHVRQMPRIHGSAHARFLWTFPLELRRRPVDLFHAVYSVPLGIPTRVILTLIEFSWFTNPEDFPASRLKLAQFRMMTRHSIRRADKIITPTRHGRDLLLSHFDLPEEKVRSIHLGFNEEFLNPCSPDVVEMVKQKFDIKQDYILSVGDLHPRKNLARLISAFDWLKRSEGIPHQLVLVGKGLYKTDHIRKVAESCSARDSIVFTDYVSIDELRALYRGAAVFAFPSLYEGFGLPVHEAMASDTPVVISDRGALPEIAGEAAVFADPLDVQDIGLAILRVLEQPSLRKEMVQKGRQQIRGYTWTEACRQTLELYHETCLRSG